MVDFSQYEYKSALTTTANGTNRPELQDIYDSAIQTTLNEMSTFYRIVNKVQNKGDYASYTVRSGRNPSIGSGGELPPVTSGFSGRKKLTTVIKKQYAFPEVTDFEIAAQATAGISPVDIYTQEVQNATVDLLSTPTTGVNAQLFSSGLGNGGLDIQGIKAWVDDAAGTLSTVTTIAGLPRAAAGNEFLNAGFFNTAAEAIGVARLRQAIAALQVAGGNLNRTIIVTTPALKNRILDTMMTGQRYTTETKFGFGVMELPTFDDLPIYADKDCESGKIYMLDMSVVEMRLLKDFFYQDMAKTATTRKGMVAMFGELVVKASDFCAVLANKS